MMDPRLPSMPSPRGRRSAPPSSSGWSQALLLGVLRRVTRRWLVAGGPGPVLGAGHRWEPGACSSSTGCRRRPRGVSAWRVGVLSPPPLRQLGMMRDAVVDCPGRLRHSPSLETASYSRRPGEGLGRRCGSWSSRTRCALADTVRRGLTAEGFGSTSRTTATTGSGPRPRHTYDVIVLDIMLPGLNGYEVCAQLRERGDLDADPDAHRQGRRVRRGRRARPRRRRLPHQAVLFVVLVARLRALLRRGAPARPVVLAAGDLVARPGPAPVSPRRDGDRR